MYAHTERKLTRGGDRFNEFLSEDMNYSSAIFMDYTEDLKKDPETCETLEDAQIRKMQ